MKITVLAENTAVSDALGHEHGLSLHIQWGERSILFDMGQSGLFAENAEKLGIDLSRVDFAVVSHGHYDHGGGLGRFLALNDHAPVYLSRFAFQPHYHGERYIGLDPALASSPRLVLTDGTCPICPGAALYGPKGRWKVWDLGSFGLSVLEDGTMMPEDFRHEQFLLLEEHGRRVLFSGCSHNGALNIASWFRPEVMIGGFHLMKQPLDGTLERYAAALDALEVRYCTCHCTGQEQYAFLRPRMKKLSYLATGAVAEI